MINSNQAIEFLKEDFDNNKIFLQRVNSLTKGFTTGLLMSLIFKRVKSKLAMNVLVSSSVAYLYSYQMLKQEHEFIFKIWKKNRQRDGRIEDAIKISELLEKDDAILFYKNHYIN